MNNDKNSWILWAQYGFAFCCVVNSSLTISVLLLLSIIASFYLKDLETLSLLKAEALYVFKERGGILPFSEREFWDHLHDASLMLNYQRAMVIAQSSLVLLSYTI
jgi:hypothetical protein